MFVQRYAILGPIIYDYKYGFGIIIVYGLFLLTQTVYLVPHAKCFFLFSLCFDSVLIAVLLVLDLLRVWYKASC